MVKWVIKRDKRRKKFSKDKIIAAILAAFSAVDGSADEYAVEKANNIADYIEALDKDKIDVEEIQDYIEHGLMSCKRKDVAKAFIIYRDERTRLRENTIDKTLAELVGGQSDYWNNENSNKNAKIVTTLRDYIAGIVSTDAARRFILPTDVCKAHDEGIIHQHDMDYSLQSALHNCCLINLDDMLRNGTIINGVMIEPQHRITTATTVATQIITAVASSLYGGTTITLSHLAPYVRMSYNEHLEQYKRRGLSEEDCIKFATEDTNKDITDSVQTFNYQVNSMSTTNGQSPFLSVCMYISEVPEYEKETAMLIEEFIKQRYLGMKNEKGVYITVAFPKLLYILDENNYTEGTKYWYLTKLAAQCTAKRLVPDYISAKIMKQLKKTPSGLECVYPCMGCRSFLTPDRTTQNYAKALNYVDGEPKFYGRFNNGVTTLNLADLAFSSGGDVDTFWKLFDERTELCHKGLKVRIDRLEKVTSDCAPILWQNGALARLDKGESLHDLIHHGYSTASLGYAGLYECVKYMTGKSHTDGAEGEAFGLKVMQAMNDKCNKWKAEEDIDYSVYGTPIESTTYKFATKLKKRFGDDIFIKLDGEDRDYITNSYHVPVFEEISPFEKLRIESKFQKLSPGGAISYVECADLTRNVDAVLDVMKFIYDNIMYAELNTKSDYCQCCGYDREILIIEKNGKLIYRCPNCGNEDPEKMNVARRVCGYISTTMPNQGRLDEIAHRYVHVDNHESCES